MEEEVGVYRYGALAPDLKGEPHRLPFRLLHLSPADNLRDVLYGQIIESQLDDHLSTTREKPNYEALSYCCGDATEVARITITSHRGGYLPLGHNLHKALVSLRSATETHALWVDAVCINQNDLDERAREVRMMHHIYKNAQKVLIWLGEPDDTISRGWNPALAFGFANRLAELRLSNPELDLNKMGRLQILLVGRRNNIKRHKTSWRKHERPPDSLRLIFQRPWFERMWVVQEAICATTATIICGSSEVDFTVFMRGVEFGLRCGLFALSRARWMSESRGEAPLPNVSAAMEMYLLNQKSTLQQLDLPSLLRRFHGSKSADPRDKLFAFYGISSLDHMTALAQDFKSIEIVPDYKVDPASLYIKVATGILQNSQTLDLFSVPRQSEVPGGQIGKLPSWVPDWSQLDTQTAPLYYGNMQQFSATSNSKTMLQHHATDSAHIIDPAINLSGYYIGRIAQVGTRYIDTIWESLIDPENPINSRVPIMATFELWVKQIVDWHYEDLDDTSTDHQRQARTVQDVVALSSELISFTRDQFETPWYMTKQDGINNTRPTKYWGQLLGKQIDRLHKKGIRVPLGIYFSVVMLSMLQKNLIRGMFDASILRSRTIAKTENGYITLVPLASRRGDSIALLRGGKTPFVLRADPAEDGTLQTKLVGDVYFPGIMEGQAWDQSRCHPITIS